MNPDPQRELPRKVHCAMEPGAGLDWASLQSLGWAFDTEIVPFKESVGESVDNLLVIGSSLEGCDWGGASRVLVLPAREGGGEAIGEIRISGEIPGSEWMRGQTLHLPGRVAVRPQPRPKGALVLAEAAAGPVWVRYEQDGVRVDQVSVPIELPDAEEDRPVFACPGPERFPSLLPVIQFLREASGAVHWTSPMRACFMFDDPNLHSTRYGFLNFRDVIREAEMRRYHVTFATVPRDAWFTSQSAAALFREHPREISLLVHGNDHIPRELALPYADGAGMSMLAQALRRIEALEAKASLKICRVMAAPHGVFSEDIMEAMSKLGFEAACASDGSIRARVQPKIVGGRPAEVMSGLPVIPRFQLEDGCLQSVLMSFYLGRPAIPTGHHQDVAGGLGLLADIAEATNSLGDVQWLSASDMVRSLYQQRLIGSSLSVRPYSRQIKLRVPSSVTELAVRPHPRNRIDASSYLLRREDGSEITLDHDESIEVTPGELVQISASVSGQVDPKEVESPRWALSPLLRRFGCEARDRLTPLLKRG